MSPAQVRVLLWATQPALGAALNREFRIRTQPSDEADFYPAVLVRILQVKRLNLVTSAVEVLAAHTQVVCFGLCGPERRLHIVLQPTQMSSWVALFHHPMHAARLVWNVG